MKKIKLNQDLIIYIQDDEIPNLISLPYGQTKTLSNLTSTNDTTVVCKSNCSFFNMQGDNGVIGTNQGLRPNFNKVDDRPNQPTNGSMLTAKFWNKDNRYEIGYFNSWDYVDCDYAFSPCAIMINQGRIDNWISTALINESHLNAINYYTLYGQLKNGKRFIVASKGYSPIMIRNRLTQMFDIDLLCLLDGGGSAQVNLNGHIDFNDGTQRSIPNALVFYKWNHKPNPPKPINDADKLIDTLYELIKSYKATNK